MRKSLYHNRSAGFNKPYNGTQAAIQLGFGYSWLVVFMAYYDF